MTGTVLLTGATGFVGRQVLRALTDRGVLVRALVREGKQGELAGFGGIESIITTPDIFAEDVAWWITACTGIDTVIHVAWYAEPGKYLQSSKNFESLLGTLIFAKGARTAGVRRFVGIGTCLEYDLNEGFLSIETNLRPLTPYAAAKVAAFMALSHWLPSQGIEFAWCRLFYLYGDGEDTRRLVPYLRAQLSSGQTAVLTGGNQIRDFLDVKKAAQMITSVAIGQKKGPINVCSGSPVTIKSIAEKIADEYGRRDLLEFEMSTGNSFEPLCIVGIIGNELRKASAPN